MGRVFTITEGLQNLGALKTGGQGSVYKGKRMGEIFSAIKILPTPIYSENETDKNYTSFMNEVAKLKKVNESPNPNIVRIISAGITDTGNLPYIEMEYIEGPDLSELLSPPNYPVFSLKDVIKVCDQLSNALAHCHKAGIRHGDIKTNNVKFNNLTGNYVLLDFGLSVMTDEQRRTSFRHAGAIEFMAPEQNEGAMLFETDIYSFGIIIYELLCGQVPFPLKDNGETSRNSVMVAHMEQPIPDAMAMRKKYLPESWPPAKTEAEMNVPFWIISMLDKCLQKSPANRFNDGVALHNFISQQSVSHQVQTSPISADGGSEEEGMVRKLQEKDRIIATLEDELQQKSEYIQRTTSDYYQNIKGTKKVSRGTFLFLLLITLALMAYIADSKYDLTRRIWRKFTAVENTTVSKPDYSATAQPEPVKEEPLPQKELENPVAIEDTGETIYRMPEKKTEPAIKANDNYRVNTIAHFFDSPDPNTRRTTFLTYKDDFDIKPLEDSGDYIYTELETISGIQLKGWLRKEDLIKTP